MVLRMEPWEGARALCSAGVLREVVRAGPAPRLWKEENDLQLTFDGAAGVEVFRIMTGPVGGSDLAIARGVALDLFAGHLREEEPEMYAEIAAGWELSPEPDAGWALGCSLSRPVRMAMMNPYAVAVGFRFDCARDGRSVGRMVIFAEADVLFIVKDDHPEVGRYGLRDLAA